MEHDGLEWGELGGEEEMVCEKKEKVRENAEERAGGG